MTADPWPATPALPGAEAPPPPADVDAHSRPRRRDTWLLHRQQWWQLLAAYVALTGLWVLAGLALEGPLANSVIVRTDERLARSLAAGRTPRLDDVSLIGSWMAETVTKVALTAVVVIVMLAVWRRWREPLMLAVPLVLEAAAFITITFVVRRPRPGVARLDESPVDTAFPSGHVAAAACYAGIVVVALWRTRRRWVPVVLAVFVLTLTAIVGWARMYRGMHYLSDVIAGVVLGLAAVLTAWWILDHASEGSWRRQRPPTP
jgi:membrane-associated phospholipid phosphatase